jgi:phosphoglycolate phosphatase
VSPTEAAPGLGVRAVVFDFDGTLGDSYRAITASVNHVRAVRGLPSLTVEQVRPHVGRGVAWLLERTVGRGSPEANAAAYRDHHPGVLREGTTLLPGAAESVRALRRAGLRLAVCSNKPVAFTRELLDHLGLAAEFAAVLGPEEVARPKPAPDMLLAALGRLGVEAGEALYVGDMAIDVETARAAGVTVWAVATGSDDRESLRRARPDRLLKRLAELPGLLAPSTPG